MTDIGDAKNAAIAAHRRQYILQENADSTVSGGTFDINFDGEYIFAAAGTLDTATPTLYCQRTGTSGFSPITSNDGQVTTLDTAGEGCTVKLSQGDKVYSQSTVVGAASDFTTVLNPTNA